MKRPEKLVWRKPTRRSFLAMVGAAAALLVVKPKQKPVPKKIWIGHF